MRSVSGHLVLVLIPLFLAGCVQRFAIRTVAGIVDEYGFATLNEESDLHLAEQSIASNLKLMEIFLKGDAGNANLNMLLCMGYTSYALGFVEDENPDRARIFYVRGRDYGLGFLKRNDAFNRGMAATIDSFQSSLDDLPASYLPAVFWTAMGWGNYINMTLTEPEALADIPRVEAMMDYVRQRDSSYYYGGAYLFLGTLYGSRPKILGGDPERSRWNFEHCLNINKGNFYLTQVYYAQSYAVQTQNRRLFEELLTKVSNASLEALPEARLPNAIAKKKARLLLSKIYELF